MVGLLFRQMSLIFAQFDAKIAITSLGRAVVARRAHNPEAVGSNPTPATNSELATGFHNL